MKLDNCMMVGIDFSPKTTQITYYNANLTEPVTLSALVMNGSLFEKAAAPNGQEVLEKHFQECFEMLKTGALPEQMWVVVTMERMEKQWISRIPAVLEKAGVKANQILMQDYRESMYYFVMNQKQELRLGDVAVLDGNEGVIKAYRIVTDSATRPAMVYIQDMGQVSLESGKEEEQDVKLLQFLRQQYEEKPVVTTYMIGSCIKREWAAATIQFLASRKKAFQGNNLYSFGACYAAMTAAGEIQMKSTHYAGPDMIRYNLGMQLRIGGEEAFYTLVSAGTNWYEAKKECDLIPDQEETLEILSQPMMGGAQVSHILRLRPFPDRPNRTVRLHVSLKFISVDVCEIQITDMGFGEMYPSSGMTWNRNIYFSKSEKISDTKENAG